MLRVPASTGRLHLYSPTTDDYAGVQVAKSRKRAYEETTIAVSRTREQIGIILVKWGVAGIQWEDQFDEGIAQLRFRWQREDGSELVARFRLEVDGEEALKKKAIDGRSGQFSQKKYARLLAARGKREHRIMLNLLKNMFEAITEGIIPAESVLLPWIEDASGETVYDKLAPKLHQLSSTSLYKALAQSEDQ